MKILINALSAKSGGGQTYLLNLLKQITDNYPHEIIFLCGDFNKDVFAKVASSCIQFKVMNNLLKNSLFRSIWERFYLPYYLYKMKIDLYFQPAVGIPISIPQNCQSATILRNMLPFDDKERKRYPFFSLVRLKMFLLKRNIILSLSKANKIIFISQYSQKVISTFIPNIEKRSLVIPHGIDEQFFNCKSDFNIKRFGLEEEKFYLYVSSLDYYKAQLELIKEWKILIKHGLKYPLVLAGYLNRTDYVKMVNIEIQRLGLEKYVILTGGISHNMLPSFYRKARALIFASSCECCPNILLEKMASGRPLFVSDIPPMPEFGGEAAYYFNPYCKGDLAKKIIEAESNYNTMLLRGKMVHDEALKHTSKSTIEKTLKYITNK